MRYSDITAMPQRLAGLLPRAAAPRTLTHRLRRDLRRGCARFADHEYGFNSDFRRILSLALNARNQGCSRNLPHLAQWLPHGCETGTVEGRTLNIVEPHDSYIFRDAQARFLKRAHGANRGDVIVSKERGKRFLAAQQLPSIWITQLR